MELNPLYFIETHTCRPVIAVLATVNEPETELFVMVLYSILILQHR
jgi:hypothetical protein